MEARALHNYNASADDELSFRKKDELKILCLTAEQDWFKARIGYNVGLVPKTFVKLFPHSWYVEEIDRDESNRLLQAKTPNGKDIQPEGAFIIRPSESGAPFTLCVKIGSAVQHLQIKMNDYGSYAIWDDAFKSLNELVAYYRTCSVLKITQLLLKDIKTELVEALYDLPSRAPGHLALKKGDIITVVYRIDKKWFIGTNNISSAPSRGLFPANYVCHV